MTTVALIPTFKPNGNLFDVLEGLRREGIERVVVDDGSGMDTVTLSRYNSSIALHDDGTHSHIGITNVLRRLNMIYHREAPQDIRPLACFENMPQGGLLITIDIPLIIS